MSLVLDEPDVDEADEEANDRDDRDRVDFEEAARIPPILLKALLAAR